MNLNLSVKPGKYIVAVSGGVDSMVLLDNLVKDNNLVLVVAHLDHGVRTDSAEDRKLVQKTAAKHGLKFEFSEARLGPNVSEDTARKVRYEFLDDVKTKYGAVGVITAHHQDDVLETAILNLIRGTGRKGISSLKSSNTVIRPMLHVSKRRIKQYAKANNIEWREDSTNQNDDYLRNNIRHNIINKLSIKQKNQLLENIQKATLNNSQIDEIIRQLFNKHAKQNCLRRSWFIALPNDLSAEVMAEWLRRNGVKSFNRKLINKLVVFSKTTAAGKRADIDLKHVMEVTNQDIKIVVRQ